MKHLSAWIACGLCACGSVTAPAPDGGGGGGSGGSGDTAAPRLVSSTPAADASGVSIVASLTLVFDEPLDPASVTPDAFALGCWACSPAYVTPTYDDATRTVTLVPLYPLGTGMPYELTIGGGIRDVAGNAFGGATVAFETRINPTVRAIDYDTGSGQPTDWTAWTLDGSGAATRSLGYNGAGADAVWLTMDDAVSAHTEWVSVGSGTKRLQKSYAAGADGKLGTADDVVSGIFEIDRDAARREIAYWSFDSAGADGRWETSDDHVVSLSTNTLEGSWIAETDTHDGAGADGQWNTADDVITRIQRYEHDARGRLVRSVELDPGPDHRAGTADDAVIDYSTQAYDAQDQYGLHVFYDAKGLDGVVGTADDGAGPDGVWFTADDVPYAYYTRTYQAGAASGASYSSPGADHVWMTADDVVASSFATAYDARRLITGSTTYKANGAIATYTIYHRDADGLATDYTAYGAPGPDGMWHTADDRPTRHYDFDDTH